MTPRTPSAADAPAAVVPATAAPARSWRGVDLDSVATCLLIPLLLFVLLAGASIWLWRGEVAKSRDAIKNALDLVGSVAAERFLNVVQVETRPLTRLTREMGAGRIDSPESFISSVRSVQDVVPSLRTLVWVETSGIVNAISVLDEENLTIGASVRQVPGWGDAFNRAYAGPRRATVVAGQWRGEPAQWLCLPYLGGAREGDRPRGALMSRLALRERAEEVFTQGSWQSFHVLVADEYGQVVYRSDGWLPSDGRDRSEAASSRLQLERAQPVEVFNSRWTLRLRPTAQFIAQRSSTARTFVLVGGLGISLLVCGVVAQALLHRRRDRRQASDHIAALEALAHVSSSISETPGSPTDLLARLAQVAARLMHMSMASVTLYDPCDDSMRVVYRHALPNPAGRDLYHVRETPCSAESMRIGRPLLFDDTAAPGAPFKPEHTSRYGVRALMLLPLMVGGKAVGVLLLADGKPRRFNRRDQRLAELWMAEAAAILSNRKLYEGLSAALSSLQRNLQQRETLYEVFTQIQAATTLREALDLIARLAPRALEVDACLVCLPHGDSNAFQIAAVTPGEPRLAQRQQLLVECPTCLSVLESGQIQQLDSSVPCPVRGLNEPGTILFVPLRGGGQTLGLLGLLRRCEPSRFESEQIRTAELFAARVAAAVENAHLHEQTRRQAESNAVLLRELNHRVGNSFASIIGLLRVAAGELAPESRHGLERAAKRVHMMSRAHDLFSGGAQSVPLRDLVETTLASLAADDDAHVHFKVELDDPDLRLFSGRAITLAMVLYELAFNAIEHALFRRSGNGTGHGRQARNGNGNATGNGREDGTGNGGGELIVRARRVSGEKTPARIAIDVVDRPARGAATPPPSELHHTNANGSQNGNGSAAGAHRGIGLQLVRSLVGRELGGSFSLHHDGKGTTATIEITLEEENECRR